MSTSQLRTRVAALRAEAAAVGELLAAEAAGMDPEELFEVTGELQGAANAVEGAQLVAIAHAGSVEHRLTGRGTVVVRHPLGFIDAMTSSEVSLATGLGQWAAGRKVGQAAALAGKFPRLLAQVLAGGLAAVNAAKVATACEGLDAAACAAVEAVMADRLAGTDPARITTLTRQVATRIAADQVAAATARNRKDRAVQVSPGPDGTTDWWARLPADRSAAAWAAITDLSDQYTNDDPDLSADQARADAFLDLLLTNVTVTAHLTLGIPVLTGPDADTARQAALAENTTAGDTTDTDPTTAAADNSGDNPAPWVRPATGTATAAQGEQFSLSAALVSGCEIPGIGYIDAATIENLLTLVPTDIGRALLDTRTGTLVETTSTAYRPPKPITDFVTTRDGTCRMWGCTRPARTCDIDHARPWPAGLTTPTNLAGLCRRHHRLKQRRRWTYQLHPDGTTTWTSPTGTRRVVLPEHAALPPPTPAPAPTPPDPRPQHSPADPPPF